MIACRGLERECGERSVVSDGHRRAVHAVLRGQLGTGRLSDAVLRREMMLDVANCEVGCRAAGWCVVLCCFTLIEGLGDVDLACLVGFGEGMEGRQSVGCFQVVDAQCMYGIPR